MLKNYLILGLVLTSLVFLSGCTGLTPEALAYANPLVKQFMEQYPNAEIQITHFTALQSLRMLENMSIDCGKNITAKDFYRIKIDDPDSGLHVVAWIDWEDKRLECAVKYGTDENKTISKPGEPIQTCKSHAEFKCYGEHVYWFDSCGHKEEKKEYCEQGCELGFCKEKANCTHHHTYKCYEGHVFWYDSCGYREEKKEYCQYGCLEGACKNQTVGCWDSDGGKDYYKAGVVETAEERCEDHCNDDGTLTEVYCMEGEAKDIKVSCPAGYRCSEGRCVTTNCTTHHEYKCYEGHVFWYDSCGHREEKKEYCQYGCAEGVCVACQVHHQLKCYNNDVYWYDSCGNKEERKHDCLYGCDGGSCIEEIINCTDSDGGKNYHEWGTATKGSTSASDHCNEDGSLTEKYCENNEIKAEQVNCSAGYECLEGECMEIV